MVAFHKGQGSTLIQETAVEAAPPPPSAYAPHTAAWRDAMILQYAGLVKYVAGRLAITLPPSLDWEDILSYGTMGLIEAVDRYDEARGVKFETFAITRIRGAIIDQLRSLDWVPRLARRRAREAERAHAALEDELGRLPNRAEIAEQMGISREDYDKILLESGTSVISLDNTVTILGDSTQTLLLETIEDPNATNPFAHAERAELEHQLAEAISHLPDREQMILSLYYRDELTLKEISTVLEISESRACQLHARAVLRLRSALASFAQSATDALPRGYRR